MRKLTLVCLFCLLSAVPVRAQTLEPPVIGFKPISDYDMPGLKKKETLDIRAMDIIQFLKFIATEGELNIVPSKSVTGPINLLINNVAIGDALEIVFAMNGLAYEVKDEIITVLTAAEYKTMYGVDFYDKRKMLVYQLKYASAKNVATLLGNIKSDIGKILYDEGTGTLVVIDTPAKIEEVKKVIAHEELPTVNRVYPTVTKTYELQYTKIDTIKDEIKKLLTADIGLMYSDARTNKLVITDLPAAMERVDKIIKSFDRKTRQVFIEAKVVEVTLEDAFKWGVDWSAVGKFISKGTTYAITPEVSMPLTLTNFGKLTLEKTESSNLSAILQILGSMTETKILSNPHITVEEGKESKIEVISKQPYEEDTTTTASGGTTTQSKTYQWVNVGVTLNVTPRINEEGYISMLIKPEVSSITDWYGGEAQASGAVPVVKSSTSQTTVTIKDGVTLIIAGLIQDNKDKEVQKIPFLADLPLLGKLFKSVSDTIQRTETVIFLTPRIVSGDEEFLLQKDLPKPEKGIIK